MNKKIVWQIIGLVVIIAALIFGLPVVLKNSTNQPKTDSQVIDSKQTQSASITIEGLYANKAIANPENQTVLEVLQSVNSLDQQVRLSTKAYSGLGVLVESIAGITNGTDGKYWQYKVNGVMPQVGADQYKLKAGDTIEWYFAAPEGPSN